MEIDWREGEVTAREATFHYYRMGTPGKPKLVLAHGFSDMGLCWEALARELAADYDILMPDARGHGKSQRVQPGELTDMVADLAAVMRALDFTQAVVGGHSMGGMVAGRLGARFPELTRALILEDPAWFGPGEEAATPGGIGEGPMGEWVRSLASKTLEQLMSECRAEHPGWSDLTALRWCTGKKQLDQNFPATRDAGWGGWKNVVGAIRCPTLLVTADVDQGGIIAPEMAEKVVGLNPLIQVAHIAGAGHHVRFAREAAYTAAVRSFLAKI